MCQVHWGIERSRSELGLLRSSINSLLIVVWVLTEPLAGTMFTRDQLPYARSLAAPVATSPLRKIMISGGIGKAVNGGQRSADHSASHNS